MDGGYARNKRLAMFSGSNTAGLRYILHATPIDGVGFDAAKSVMRLDLSDWDERQTLAKARLPIATPAASFHSWCAWRAFHPIAFVVLRQKRKADALLAAQALAPCLVLHSPRWTPFKGNAEFSTCPIWHKVYLFLGE